VSTAAVPAPFPRLRLPDWDVPWYALAPLLLIPVMGGTPVNLNNILFAVEVLMLVAGIRRPVWIPAALLISEMTASNYIHDIGGLELSNRLLLAGLSFLVVMPHITRRIELGRRASLTIALACIFIGLITFVNMAKVDDAATLEFLRFIATGLFVMVLIPMTIRAKEDVLDLGRVLLIVAAVAALVAVFQHYSDSRGTPLYEVVPHAGAGGSFISWETRSLGLSENPILAGNVQMIVGLFALGFVLLAPMEPSTKRVIAVLILLGMAASYFTYTRSWAISVGMALVVLAAFYRGQYRREFLIFVVIGAMAFWYWSDLQGTRYTATAEDDSSAAARPVLWELSVNIAIDHPWTGVGYGKFLELSPQYTNTVPRELLEQQNAFQVVGKYQPHNDPLNVWVSWGFFALVVYVTLIVVVALNFIHTYRNAADQVIRGLAMGGLAALIAYETNSLFHNFFENSLAFWIIAGFSLVLLKVDRPPVAIDSPLPRLMRAGRELAWKRQ